MEPYNEVKFGENNGIDTGLAKFFTKVFSWMFFGLLATAIVSFYISTQTSYKFKSNLIDNYLIIFAIEIVIVFVLSAKATTLNPFIAKLLFMVYAIMNGLIISFVILAYGLGVISTAFLLTCIFFGTMAVYGFVTKSDLTKLRPILMSALISIIILSLLNTFVFHMAMFDMILSIFGLGVFMAFTAYDINKLKKIYFQKISQGSSVDDNIAIYGALSLYLDFINIFLRLVRILGGKK